MNTVVNYSKIDQHPQGADRLFKTMMRLEFSLKELDCIRTIQGHDVTVDWDRFANERLGAEFFSSIRTSGRFNCLIETPPKRQIVDGNGHLSWEQTGIVTRIQELTGALRRVRNNLFHGGKSGEPDGDRDEQLVENALAIIDEILMYDEDLRMIFEGQY